MDTFWLALRVVLSLAVVLGLIWALARVRKRVSPAGAGAVTIMSKIPVTKKGAVLLVQAGDKTLLIGATDTQVSLLSVVDLPVENDEPKKERTVIDIDALVSQRQLHEYAAEIAPGAVVGQHSVSRSGSSNQSALAGSVLSPATWRQLADLVKDKTARS